MHVLFLYLSLDWWHVCGRSFPVQRQDRQFSGIHRSSFYPPKLPSCTKRRVAGKRDITVELHSVYPRSSLIIDDNPCISMTIPVYPRCSLFIRDDLFVRDDPCLSTTNPVYPRWTLFIPRWTLFIPLWTLFIHDVPHLSMIIPDDFCLTTIILVYPNLPIFFPSPQGFAAA